MNGKHFGRAFVAVGLLIALTVFLAGCGTEEEPTAQEQTTQTQKMASTAQETVDAAQGQVAEAVQQTTCPVMGGPINKAIFVEYQGKEVYFCCKGCETEFEKDPEKYVAKLPQFQQEQ